MSRVCRCGSTAEQLICNQQVIGSNPIIGFYFYYGWVPEWPKGADCKSVSDAFEGSNPSPSTCFTKVKQMQQRHNGAGWSSLEARRAHNPKVVSSNLTPATLKTEQFSLNMPRQLSWQSRGLKILVSLVRFRFWAFAMFKNNVAVVGYQLSRQST